MPRTETASGSTRLLQLRCRRVDASLRLAGTGRIAANQQTVDSTPQTLLPRLLHLHAAADDAWIASVTQQAVPESHVGRPGGEAMLARMSEMMFVDAVQRYADHLPPKSAGGLAGPRDRVVGRALALMHEHPARDWILDELGRRVGKPPAAWRRERDARVA